MFRLLLFYFTSDLNLGGVLLFPIDDKESRNEGQDLVSNTSLIRTKFWLTSPFKTSPVSAGLSVSVLVARAAVINHHQHCTLRDHFYSLL